jgi:TRAP-type C4-dicarboxylate transport system permease small subunit
MKKIYQVYCKIEEFVCGAAFLALITLVFVSAGLRAVHITFSWNIDMALLLLAWASFLGADCAFRAGQLVGIDIITRLFPKKIQKSIEILVLLVILGALIIFVIFGIKLVQSDWDRMYQSMPISFSWATMSLPVASLSMSISTIIKIKNGIVLFNKKNVATSDHASVK